MSSENMHSDELISVSNTRASLLQLSIENQSDVPNQSVELEGPASAQNGLKKYANTYESDSADVNATGVTDDPHDNRPCSDRALIRTFLSFDSLYHRSTLEFSPSKLFVSMPTFSTLDMLCPNPKAMMTQQISSPKASMITDFPTSEPPSEHDSPFKMAENHGSPDKSPPRSKSASVISTQYSCEDIASQHSVSEDDSLLPGSRRRRFTASDDSDNSDSDDNLLFEEAKSDKQAEEHDCNEPVNQNKSPETTLADLKISGTAEESPTIDHTEPAIEVPSEDLDADRDKSNPAYVPRTGTYFMHDYRESDKGASNGNMLKGRADQHRWAHDRFRYYDQAPRSSRELIRRYGYDIRKEPYDQQPTDVLASDDRESHRPRDVGKLDQVDPSPVTKPIKSPSNQHFEPRVNSRHPKRSSGNAAIAPSNNQYPEQGYSRFINGRRRFTMSSRPKAYTDFSNDVRRNNVEIPRKAHHHNSDNPNRDFRETSEGVQAKQFPRKSEPTTEKKKFAEIHSESKPMRYSALRQNAPRVSASDTVGDRRNVSVAGDSDGYQTNHISDSAQFGHSQRQINSSGRNFRKLNGSEGFGPFRSGKEYVDGAGGHEFPVIHQGRDKPWRETQSDRRPVLGRRRPLKPLDSRDPGWLQPS